MNMLKKITNLLSSKRNFQEIEKIERKLIELEGAIERLEKTAPEVPVQEQSNYSLQGKCEEPCKLWLKPYGD